MSKYSSREKLDNQTWIPRIHKDPDVVMHSCNPSTFVESGKLASDFHMFTVYTPTHIHIYAHTQSINIKQSLSLE